MPQWYQYRFFKGEETENKFFYLDLKPETITTPKGKKYLRNALLKWGPPKCFFEDDLYTTKFQGWESTEIEQKFFGKLDTNGNKAVEYFSKFEHKNVNPEAFKALLSYMSVQKLRTPKGLSYLASIANNFDKNFLLLTMQQIHRMHCAIWTECIWNIVDASNSETKFILSDHPVTVYNQECFPGSKWCQGANDPDIFLNGTYTIFPLSVNKSLLLTNLSWVRNPYGNALKERPHPELFRTAMFNFTSIQTGHMLSEQEVVAINYIIKKRAYLYIAAAKKEWLYPESKLAYKRWDKIGSSYILMPDPRSVSFSSEILIGYNNKRADAFDEYGRRPWHIDYKEKNRHDYEWDTFHAFQGEYSRLFGPKRRGLAFEFGSKDRTEDSADYHAYHLGLEQKHKSKIYIKRRGKRKD